MFLTSLDTGTVQRKIEKKDFLWIFCNKITTCSVFYCRMNDVELIAQIQKGNEHAFTFLVRKYQKLVLHMVVRIVKQNADIEDVCQEVFIKVFKNLKQFKGESKLSTWIAKIAYNVALNHIRKDERKLLSVEDTAWEHTEPMVSELPDKLFENSELKAQIVREINELPLQYRTVATFFYLEQFSYLEIAEITGIKQATLRSYVSRARAILKEKLIFALKK